MNYNNNLVIDENTYTIDKLTNTRINDTQKFDTC